MAKIFILDDLKSRHDKFKMHLTGHNIVSAHSFVEAIKLYDASFDVVFLDCDLGAGMENLSPTTNKDYYQNSGRRFADTFVDTLNKQIVFVHSLNTDERTSVANKVNGLGIPFTYIDWENLSQIIAEMCNAER